VSGFRSVYLVCGEKSARWAVSTFSVSRAADFQRFAGGDCWFQSAPGCRQECGWNWVWR